HPYPVQGLRFYLLRGRDPGLLLGSLLSRPHIAPKLVIFACGPGTPPAGRYEANNGNVLPGGLFYLSDRHSSAVLQKEIFFGGKIPGTAVKPKKRQRPESGRRERLHSVRGYPERRSAYRLFGLLYLP